MNFAAISLLVVLSAAAGEETAAMPSMLNSTISVVRSARDFESSDIDNAAWSKARAVKITKYWSGAAAPKDRQMIARLLWTDAAIYARFDALQKEPLVVSDSPDTSRKTLNLWDRDVVEIFLAPDISEPNRYFEFEAAPTGEWVDVGIDLTSGKRKSNFAYQSGMTAAGRIEAGKVVVVMKIPWAAFARRPAAGDKWLGNLLRCVGSGATRGYLALSPTQTAKPNFHVPDKFVEFRFD